uniref:Reverse transcriptase domain-containing protein n=1 Tax=Salarias fasciatus TaxID=181472 RepID=A0A672JMA1_SALFA
MRRLINIIDYATIHNLESIIISLDAEKAFDRVNWKFLFGILTKFGFGTSFIDWIKILYNNPAACVKTNEQTSSSFCLQRGTRQGCPLSPSLFAIFIEPLAAAIRQNKDIRGILANNKIEHKISLYADDVLLFLQNSPSSISQTITLIDKFSLISDYSINWSKTTAMPINCDLQSIPNATIQSGNIRYLGINISPRISELLKLNYVPLLKSTEDDLLRWRRLPISLMGRVATIKMMTLPKVNYLFSMIPTKPSSGWFKSLDSYISKFLWKNKPSRISLKTLQQTKDRGGLDLPNFSNYFIASKLQYISKWLKPNNLDEPWLDVEQALCEDLVISDLPFISPTIKSHRCFKSVNISSSLM